VANERRELRYDTVRRLTTNVTGQVTDSAELHHDDRRWPPGSGYPSLLALERLDPLIERIESLGDRRLIAVGPRLTRLGLDCCGR
jgi:hypothetical protein